MLSVAGVVPALDLGAIEAQSHLYEPLSARIALHDVGRGELKGLNVTLGTPAQFELAGVPRENVLKLLEFEVAEQDDGGSHVRVWTREPIIESVLTFLVSAEWGRGRAIRGYKLKLSAAIAGAAQPPATEPPPAQEVAVLAEGSVESEPAAESEPETASPPRSESPEPRGSTYGPVRTNDTLWSIASRARPDAATSVQRMMLAILEANPEAFDIRNVNALNAGAVLRIPSSDEIGSDDRAAAIAEVRRQQAEWTTYRESVRTGAPVPSASPTETSPRRPEVQPEGRIEVVAPESPESMRVREDDAGTSTLRNELALAVEEADAARRENADLMMRLTDAERHIEELGQLVALKNEEVAALQAELRAPAATGPKPAMTEDGPEPAPAQMEAKPAPAPMEAEPEPAAEEGAKPVQAPAEADEVTVPPEPKSLPFNLDALPVNPVFLVGGAGLLLILLGVVALLRRRRAATGEGGAADSAAASSAGEDSILLELEAVAADLADDAAKSPGGHARPAAAAGVAAGIAIGAAQSDAGSPEADDRMDRQIANLWQDAPEPERDGFAAAEEDDDAVDVALELAALADDDSGSEMLDSEDSDEFDIGSLADLVDPAEETDAKSDESRDGASGGLESLFRDYDAAPADSDAPESVPAFGDVESPDDDGDRTQGPPGTAGGDDSAGSSAGLTAAAKPGTDRTTPPPAQAGLDAEPGAHGDLGDSKPPARLVLDHTMDGDQSEALSLDDVGDDEIQTKIDLAQVYMEMGDTDGARGFLEAVLTEGDPDQKEIAREMLSRLN